MQVRGAYVTAVLGVRAARWLNPRCWELVKKQGGEARILGDSKGQQSVLGYTGGPPPPPQLTV